MANDANVSSISKSRSIEEMADFWDTHDATDFEDQTHEVDVVFDIRTVRQLSSLPDQENQH